MASSTVRAEAPKDRPAIAEALPLRTYDPTLRGRVVVPPAFSEPL